MLDRFGLDLTARARAGELIPVIGRASEIEQTIEILSRRTKNNPVLIGEAGVGKTAIVEGSRGDRRRRRARAAQGRRVVALDLPAMLAGTRYRATSRSVTQTMDEIAAHKGEIIVFIDEVHTVVGAGGSGTAAWTPATSSSRASRGATCTWSARPRLEYRRIEKDPALERRFQPVKVAEPSIEDAVRILEGPQARLRAAPRRRPTPTTRSAPPSS
jgi:ATP-dependent Clp protease ATP-binding subunit ClpC